MERRVTLLVGALQESDEQGAAESYSLPLVGDRRGEFNHIGLAGYLDVAHDADAPSGKRIDREQCFMCVVIDIHHAVELVLRDPWFGTGEPQMPRLIGKSSDRCTHQWAITALEWADGDYTAVTKLQWFE